MLKLLQLLIYGHSHKWKIIDRTTLENKYRIPVGAGYTLQCEECGELKYKTTGC